MRFSLYLILLASTFALTVTCTDATGVGSPSDSKKMEVKKALTRLRRMHRADTEERVVVPPYPMYSNMLHGTSTTSTQSSQILHAVVDGRPLPKAAKAVIAVVSVGIITGAVIGAAMLAKMLDKVSDGEEKPELHVEDKKGQDDGEEGSKGLVHREESKWEVYEEFDLLQAFEEFRKYPESAIDKGITKSSL